MIALSPEQQQEMKKKAYAFFGKCPYCDSPATGYYRNYQGKRVCEGHQEASHDDETAKHRED